MDEVLKILVVDDDDIDRMAVRRALRAGPWKMEVSEASDADAAIAVLKEGAIDCALMDYQLPGRDGLSILREVRAAGVRTPVIMLTGQGNEQVAVELMKAGASDYLTKGQLSLERLTQSVRNAVRVYRAESAAALAGAMVRESENRFRTMADSAPVLLWVSDSAGQCTYFNEGWLKFTGRSMEEELGDGWTAGVHGEDLARCVETYQKNFADRTAFEMEYRLRRWDGEYRWVWVRGIPRFLPDGTFAGYIGSCMDITERRQIEQQRVQSLQREQAARAQAEAARAEAEAAGRRLAFLAEAGAVLGKSLDFTKTLADMARLAVPAIADWCAIDMLGEDGSIQRLAVQHTDPSKVRWAHDLHERYPTDINADQGVAHVLRTGRSEIYPEVTDEMLASVARDAEHLRVIRELGMVSGMLVPLTARGRTLGVMTFVSAESGRRFGEEDLALAEDLARRAGAAVDNARIYREAQEAFESKRQAMAHLDTLLATAPVGLAFFDHELRYVRINHALARSNGIPPEQHLGRRLGEVEPRLRETVGQCLREVLRTGRPILDVEVRRPAEVEGEPERILLASYYPVRSGEAEALVGVGAVVVDITDRKRAERELTAAKEAAEQSARAAEQNARQAEAANRAKDQFLAVLSHELRTPLTPVLSIVSALEAEKGLSSDVRGQLEMIRRNVELEARLIDDLLDLTRIAKGKLQLNLESTDAHAAARRAAEIWQSEIDAKRLQVTFELKASRHVVRADSARLQQIFWNLLKNAVKFTPAGGQIVVSSRNEECSVLRGQRPRGAESAEAEPVRLSPRSSVQGATCHPCLVVSFSDTGIGIQPDLLPRIFDAFEQGERVVSRQFGGLGLGLAISRALVEAHGGEVSAVSEGPGRGATFSVCLPTIAAPAARPEVSSSAGGEAEAKPLARILLVDDHADTSRAMKRLLQRLGYDIETADSVHSALARAKNRAFDLLISDIGLPDGSGLDLMRDIQNVQKIQGIALSGFGMDEDVRRSKEAGFAEHLTKPVNFQRLESVIRQLTH